MTENGRRRDIWPEPEQWRAYALFMVRFYLVFFPVYFGAGYLTDGSGRALDLFLSVETGIPLIPWMMIPYLSLFPLFLLPLFHLPPGQLKILSQQSTAALAVAGTFFVLLPGRLGFPPPQVSGWLVPAFDIVAAVDTKHNLVPSLHVTFAALILIGSAQQATPAVRSIYRVWLAVMMAATVFVHQHHLIDIAAGLALAVAVRRIWPMNAGAMSVRA